MRKPACRASHRVLGRALVAAALSLFAVSCAAPRTYDRGESVSTTLEVMFGDPEEDAESFAADVASIFERAGRDADEFPQALADFAYFFY